MRPLEGVRELRERRMLTQQELADLAGVSLFTIQRIERGEGSVRPKTGRAIAAALGVTVEELLPKAQAPLWPEEPQKEAPSERREREELAVALMQSLVERGERLEETLKVNATASENTSLFIESQLALRTLFEEIASTRQPSNELQKAFEELEAIGHRVSERIGWILHPPELTRYRMLRSANRGENLRALESEHKKARSGSAKDAS